MKRILAIDTCGGVGSVQLFDLATGSLLGNATLPGRETQEKLLPAIEQVLSNAGCALEEVFALAVVTGPGSFTGVRIGLAAVKGLTEAAGMPVIALSRLTVLARALKTPPVGRVHAWLDAGRGDVYCIALQPKEDKPLEDEALTSATQARSRVEEGDTIVVLEPALADRYADVESRPLLLALEDYLSSLRSLSRQAAEAENFADSALLDASYLRIPDAEIALRAKSGLQPSSV